MFTTLKQLSPSIFRRSLQINLRPLRINSIVILNSYKYSVFSSQSTRNKLRYHNIRSFSTEEPKKPEDITLDITDEELYKAFGQLKLKNKWPCPESNVEKSYKGFSELKEAVKKLGGVTDEELHEALKELKFEKKWPCLETNIGISHRGICELTDTVKEIGGVSLVLKENRPLKKYEESYYILGGHFLILENDRVYCTDKEILDILQDFLKVEDDKEVDIHSSERNRLFDTWVNKYNKEDWPRTFVDGIVNYKRFYRIKQTLKSMGGKQILNQQNESNWWSNDIRWWSGYVIGKTFVLVTHYEERGQITLESPDLAFLSQLKDELCKKKVFCTSISPYSKSSLDCILYEN